MLFSRRRWAVLISGRGSNLGALLDLRDGVDVALVVSSSPSAYGLLRARRAGVPTRVLPRPIDWPALDAELRALGVTHVFLAGFMRIVPETFVVAWENRLVNLHPSLLPKYPGLKSIERAFAADDDVGVTVHAVDAGVDTGPIVARRRSLNRPKGRGYSLELAELQVHIDEQRLVREVALKWSR